MLRKFYEVQNVKGASKLEKLYHRCDLKNLPSL